MIKKILIFSFTLFLASSWLCLPKLAYSQALPSQAQLVYQGILKIAREAIQSPKMSREQFEGKISALIKGKDDDQLAAKAGALVMFDSIEKVHELNEVESKLDYTKIFDGSRYRSQDDIVELQKILKKVNEITLATIESGNNSINRLEEELERAEVSRARVKLEIEAAKQREHETKDPVAQGWKRLKAKIALNEARINALEFLRKRFGNWKYKEEFIFSSPAEQEDFKGLMTGVEKLEYAFGQG